MTASFADAARRCCGLSGRLLGWRPAEFWNATPAELAMVLADPSDAGCVPPPTRETIAQMMERDSHG